MGEPPPFNRPAFEEFGACHVAGVLSSSDLRELLGAPERILENTAGRRIFGDAPIRRLCDPAGSIGRLALTVLPGARPVRALLFDKTPDNNWAVAWHQDRTIAVTRRIDTGGFGPWSSKAGTPHVEPPFAVLAGMITLRVHLDDCGSDNAPLLVALGSHRLGKVPAATVAAEAAKFEIATCIAAAGDIWIYATPILHASAAAMRPRRRRVLQLDFAASPLPADLEWAGI